MHRNLSSDTNGAALLCACDAAVLTAKDRWVKAPVNSTISANAGSIEQAEDALILFEVADIFPVVRRNADCPHHRGLLAPDTRAGDCGARGERSGAAQLAERDAHAVERTIKLCDVARAAVVGRNCKDAEHFRIRAIGGADFTAHL